MVKIELTAAQAKLVVWELSQGIMGDGGAYDKSLKRIIAKIRDKADIK